MANTGYALPDSSGKISLSEINAIGDATYTKLGLSPTATATLSGYGTTGNGIVLSTQGVTTGVSTLVSVKTNSINSAGKIFEIQAGDAGTTPVLSISFEGVLKPAHLSGGTCIDFTSAGTSADIFMANATSFTPNTTWAITNTYMVNKAPLGWLQINVGSQTRYIPFWD